MSGCGNCTQSNRITAKLLFFVAILLFPSFSFAQLRPRVQPREIIETDGSKIYLYNATWKESNRSIIYEMDSDCSVFAVSASLPKTIKIPASSRLKIRQNKFWVTDGKKIYNKSLDTNDEKWMPIKLPNGMTGLRDFEVISDTELIICCAEWPVGVPPQIILNVEMFSVPSKKEYHFVINYISGSIKTVFYSNDLSDYNRKDPSDSDHYFGLNLAEMKSSGYLCKLDSKILIIGSYSGKVSIWDVNNKKLSQREIIPKNELPGTPLTAVENGLAIAWAAPLGDSRVLFCCQVWPADDGSYRVPTHCFRALNLNTGEVSFIGPEYKGIAADPGATYFERGDALLGVSESIAGK
jgi:WD40 repeat protein